MMLQDWLSQLELSQRQTDPPAPARCALILQRLHFRKFCPIITVGGTNGKGSTTHILAAYLEASGKKVGRFISPHLLRYNERIAINGQLATDAEIVAAFTKIKAVQGDIELGYFDYSLLAAVLIFQEAKVDWIVLEVGLGGRLDATNCLDTDCAIITTIHFDHVDVLGHHRDLIGFEKAGIMRPGRLAVCGDFNPPDSIGVYAKKIGAELIWVTEADRAVDLPPGHFPKQNGYTALVALKALAERGLLEWDQALFKAQVAGLVIPGRMQVLQQQPQIIVDVAHNEESVAYLVNFLKQHHVQGKTYAVFSVLKDKDYTAIMQTTFDYFTEWHLVELDSPRALSLQELGRVVRAVHGNKCVVNTYPGIQALMRTMGQRVQPMDRIVVFGSFLIASLFLKWYNTDQNKREL